MNAIRNTHDPVKLLWSNGAGVIQNKRFLIVNPFGIGDVLFTTPLIEAIKLDSPDNYIGYLCNIRTMPLLLSNKNVNKVFVFEKDAYRRLWRESKLECLKRLFKLLSELKKQRFDAAFDLSMAQEYGLFLSIAGIRERFGYNYRKRGIFLTKSIALENGFCCKHMVEYYLKLLKLARIDRPDENLLKLYISSEQSRQAAALLSAAGIRQDDKFIAVTPGAGQSWGDTSFRKQWPKEYFAEAISAIIESTGFKAVLLGNGTDSGICGYIKSRQARCVNLCGKTDLLVFAAVLEKSSLLIANDGGPLHIGVAVGAKTLSVFGPVDEKVYGPYPSGKDHIVVKNDNLECRPCYRNFKIPACEDLKCLNDISVSRVVSGAERLLKR